MRMRFAQKTFFWSVTALMALVLLTIASLPVAAETVPEAKPWLTAAGATEESADNTIEVTIPDTEYVSASLCGTCHPQHYKEWAASPHAYAQISPMFSAMNRALVKKTNGTQGDFCIRCHTPVGMEAGEDPLIPNEERHPVALEGVTCISCHRRSEPYGKVSGRFHIQKGDIHDPVYGSFQDGELDRVINSGEYVVNAERGKGGRNIHAQALKLDQISQPAFCGGCHDVNNVNGFRLEEAFSEYKAIHKGAEKHTCQDCHMSTEPGLPSGYDHRPIAIVGGKPTKARKKTNHRFIGPDYSIAHPGIFPHNVYAKEFASVKEWVDFDWKAGWGTDDFEFGMSGDEEFPERWEDASDRYEARSIIDENLELLDEVAEERKSMLQKGYLLEELRITRADDDDIRFEVDVKNGTTGHNVPTGFDAERVVFLRVTVTDANGKAVFKSGDLDPNGDLRDDHSLYVHNGEIPRDEYLFNLQSKFLVTMQRGGEREQVLPVNNSVSPLPFLRPATNATLLKGRPERSRKHRQTIPPLATRTAKYRVDDDALKGSSGPYKVKVQLVAGMVPVNLVAEVAEVGFPYNMSPREVADAVVAGHQVLWEKSETVDIK